MDIKIKAFIIITTIVIASGCAKPKPDFNKAINDAFRRPGAIQPTSTYDDPYSMQCGYCGKFFRKGTKAAKYHLGRYCED